MKLKIISILALGFFFLIPSARAQFTTVTATVHDPNGIPYAGGTVTANLTPASPGGWTLNGQPYSGRISGGALDSTGTFTINFGDNGVILPAGSQWAITVASNPGGIAPPLGTGAQSFTVTMTITGASQNISTTLNAAAPALTHFAGTGGTVTSVSCGNLVNVFTCAVANPTTTPALSFLPVLVGPTLDCSAQPGAPDFGVQVNNCLASLAMTSEGTGIADVSKFASPQNMSTQIVDSIGAMIYGCALSVNENSSANFSLTTESASLVGCPGQTFIITQNSNVDAVVASGSQNVISDIDFEGQNGTFTGNGVFLNGATSGSVKGNLIEGFSNDLIKLTSTGLNDISGNTFAGPGLHTLEAIGAGSDNFHNNSISSSFAETGDTIVTSGSAVLTIANNLKIALGGGTHRIMTTCNTCQTTINGNVFSNIGSASTQEVLNLSGTVFFSGNKVQSGSTGGAAAVHMLGNGSGSDNFISTTDGDGFVIDNGIFVLSNTTVSIGSLGSEWCGVKITGVNQIGSQVHNTSAGLAASFDTDGVCVLTVAGGTHMLDILVDGVYANGFGHGYSFTYSNAGNYNTNVSGVFQNISCTHSVACLKRSDSQNNKNFYTNIQPDGAFDAGTGSANDVLVQNVTSFSFANLPSRSVWGQGSHFYCSDCSLQLPTTAGGQGAYIVAQGSSNWSGNQTIAATDTHTTEITGNYGPITLLGSAAATGSYLVTIYTEVSTSVATSTITPSITYHDDTGAQTQAGALFSAATAGTIQSLTFPVRFVTGTALNYSTTTANSPKYKIIARVEAQ